MCGRPDWCVFAGAPDAPEAVICPRTESPKRIGDAGWLHRLRPSATAWPAWTRTIRQAVRLLESDADGRPDFAKLAKRLRPEQVVVVADRDEADQRGAERLASVLVAYVPAVKVITPPAGIKDARAWRRLGATAADVLGAIDAATVRQLTVAARRR